MNLGGVALALEIYKYSSNQVKEETMLLFTWGKFSKGKVSEHQLALERNSPLLLCLCSDSKFVTNDIKPDGELC